MNIDWRTDRALHLVQLEIHTLAKSRIVDWDDPQSIRTIATIYGLRQVTAFLDFYGYHTFLCLRNETDWATTPYDDDILTEIRADYCAEVRR